MDLRTNEILDHGPRWAIKKRSICDNLFLMGPFPKRSTSWPGSWLFHFERNWYSNIPLNTAHWYLSMTASLLYLMNRYLTGLFIHGKICVSGAFSCVWIARVVAEPIGFGRIDGKNVGGKNYQSNFHAMMCACTLVRRLNIKYFIVELVKIWRKLFDSCI